MRSKTNFFEYLSYVENLINLFNVCITSFISYFLLLRLLLLLLHLVRQKRVLHTFFLRTRNHAIVWFHENFPKTFGHADFSFQSSLLPNQFLIHFLCLLNEFPSVFVFQLVVIIWLGNWALLAFIYLVGFSPILFNLRFYIGIEKNTSRTRKGEGKKLFQKVYFTLCFDIPFYLHISFPLLTKNENI